MKVDLLESRNPATKKEMSAIDSLGGASGIDLDKIEDILDKCNASQDDSGAEGYFSTMSDSDIHNAWVQIKNYIQQQVDKGRDVDLGVMKSFDCKRKLTKQDFMKQYGKMTGKNPYEDGYIQAVSDICTAYNLKLK